MMKNKKDSMQYTLLTNAVGRAQADILENYLRAKDIDVVLVQDAISHVTHILSYARVQVFVPKENIRQARQLLKTYYENQNNPKEKNSMANKKKIEERLEAERKARQARYIQIGGVGIVLVLIVLAFWAFGPKTGAASPALTPEATVVNAAATQPASSAPQVTSKQYSAAPPMTIDKTKKYFATVKMAKGGEFVIQLYPDKAPITVNSFVFLAKEGFFNGVTFHRVLDGFMAQGGDPTGTGTGGPGYQFVNEDSDLTFDKAGVVAMANAGRDTNGSQFFITFGPTTQLNGGYTIFGQVIKGMDVVNAITRRDPQANPTFAGDTMESVTITEQ
jgi:cyclophilin family peptidyl-prolyl cis-trans isomerase